MTIRKFKEELSKFPDDYEVTITDGFQAECYHGNFYFSSQEESGVKFLDIGIGGLQFNDKYPFIKNE